MAFSFLTKQRKGMEKKPSSEIKVKEWLYRTRKVHEELPSEPFSPHFRQCTGTTDSISTGSAQFSQQKRNKQHEVTVLRSTASALAVRQTVTQTRPSPFPILPPESARQAAIAEKASNPKTNISNISLLDLPHLDLPNLIARMIGSTFGGLFGSDNHDDTHNTVTGPQRTTPLQRSISGDHLEKGKDYLSVKPVEETGWGKQQVSKIDRPRRTKPLQHSHSGDGDHTGDRDNVTRCSENPGMKHYFGGIIGSTDLRLTLQKSQNRRLAAQGRQTTKSTTAGRLTRVSDVTGGRLNTA